MAQPASFQELLTLVIRVDGIFGKGRVRLWRGQSDISWGLDSSAYRRLLVSKNIAIDTPPNKVETEIVSYETYLLKRAEYHGYRRAEGRLLSDLELLARLRHYGAATRLLDCSKNALVALWFAVSQNPDLHGALFGVQCNYIVGPENELQGGRYDKVIERLSKFDVPMAWAPVGLTPRTAAQHSVFIYSAAGNSRRGSVRIDNAEDAFLPIAISPDIKQDVTDILKESFDIYHFSLFPDIEGFSDGNNELADRWAMERW